MSKWEDFWGDEAKYDIASDCELIYEKYSGKSCVLWTPDKEKFETPTDDLKSRPEEYLTHGYTSDFESWGIEMTTKACEFGYSTVEDVIKFIEVYTKIHMPKPTVDDGLKEFEVITEYHKTFKAHSHEEAVEMAHKDLCNMDGLGNDWTWSEYCSSMNLTNL